MLRTHVAARQYFQRGEKFLAEEILAAADAGQCRGRADHRAIADLGAIARLDAPDGGDVVTVHAIGLFDRVEDGAVLRQDGAPIGDALLAHEQIEIVPERLGELGLRVEQIHDPQVGREPRDIGIVQRARDAAGLRQRPESLETAAEIGGGAADRLRRRGDFGDGGGDLVQRAVRQGGAALDGAGEGADPVSYTHLDVYKRQI